MLSTFGPELCFGDGSVVYQRLFSLIVKKDAVDCGTISIILWEMTWSPLNNFYINARLMGSGIT
jgi:hypothetical protein